MKKTVLLLAPYCVGTAGCFGITNFDFEKKMKRFVFFEVGIEL